MSIVAKHGFKLGRTAVPGEDYWIDFVKLADHSPPAFGGKVLGVLLGRPENQGIDARLPHFAPVGIGVNVFSQKGDSLKNRFENNLRYTNLSKIK